MRIDFTKSTIFATKSVKCKSKSTSKIAKISYLNLVKVTKVDYLNPFYNPWICMNSSNSAIYLSNSSFLFSIVVGRIISSPQLTSSA